MADVLPSHLNLADVLADKSTRRGWKIPETTLAYPWIIRMFPDIKYIHWIFCSKWIFVTGNIFSRTCPDFVNSRMCGNPVAVQYSNQGDFESPAYKMCVPHNEG